MNRLELLSILLLLGVGIIFFVKSKAFDRFIVWLTRGSKPTTVADIKKTASTIDEAKTKAADLIAKQEAETKALQQLEVAKLERQAADQNAAKQVALATAQKESLALGGAISERDRVLAEIARDQAIGVARELSKIAVPSTVFNGASGTAGGPTNSMDNLISVTLMEKLNALPKSR